MPLGRVSIRLAGPRRTQVAPGLRRSATAFVLSLLVVVPTGCTGDTATSGNTEAARTIQIGLLAPTTGGNAARGKSATQGAELAVDIVNEVYAELPLPLAAEAGLGTGARLSLMVGDTAGPPTRTEQRVAELLSDTRAAGLVLADNLTVARAVSREVDQRGVTLIDACNSAEALTDLSRSGQFRIAPSDRELIETTFGLLHRQQSRHRIERIVLIAGPTDRLAIDELQTTVSDVAGRFGFLMGNTVLVSGNPGNAAELAARVAAERAEVALFAVADAGQAALAVDLAARLRGVRSVIAFGSAVGALDQARTASPELLRTAGWSPDYARRHLVAAAVTGMYERRYRAPMDDVAAATFTATLALAVAINQAGSADPAAVREAMQRLRLSATQTIMPWNGIRFDANGNNQLAAGVVEQRGSGGFHVVYPSELATLALSWPA